MTTETNRTLTTENVVGAKTGDRGQRPEYVRNPDRSRDPPENKERDAMRGRTGAKIWRKAREGKL